MNSFKTNHPFKSFFLFILFGTYALLANGQGKINGEYSDWPAWNGGTGNKYYDSYLLQLRKTISNREYLWLQQVGIKWRVPDDCAKAIELKNRLYANVPDGCFYCKNAEERKAQRSDNLRRLYRACEFDWELNDFIKKCNKNAAKTSNKTNASGYARPASVPVHSGTPLIHAAIKSYRLGSPSFSSDVHHDMSGNTTPVGLNYSNGAFQIMFLTPNIFGLKSWDIQYYKTAKEISAGMNSKMQNENLIPMGLTSDNAGLSILFIETNTTGTAWQLVESKQDLTEVSKNISPYLTQGYFPVGITLHGDFYYVLLIKTKGNSFKTWEIKGYRNKATMDQEIQKKISQKIIPFGFLQNEGVYNVLFIGL